MNILDNLNIKQEEAVKCIDGPLLVLAGAGSGKTTTMAAKVKYLVDIKNILPSDIVIISFNTFF